ncbi:CBS domain-containing protein [uncultured Methanobrevibacter sp.]|uniref:CBS domain-containing protein n=1 Tax=uncultured Methanobrevibacter sp. TaxID=253161 RepID=UPI0025EFF76D|nr:CBS domain-containing protein [uncultured Methanobrevibacter sp.]
MLEKTKVKDLMTKDVLTVDCEEATVFAFEKLMKHKISAMPVVNEGKMVGIVTATDLGHNLILDKYQYGTKVKSVMVKDVATVSSEDTVKDAIAQMFNEAPGDNIINQLPVVDDGELVGIISDGDIIKFIKKNSII